MASKLPFGGKKAPPFKKSPKPKPPARKKG